MSLFGGRGKRPVEAAAPCRFCRVETSERDRTGEPAHKACVAGVIETVTEEARPSRDPHDLAQRVRKTVTGGGDSGPSVAARFEATVYATASALVGDWRRAR